eukprot:3085798-Prorocentrum_lima.AAC.1
MAFNVAPMVPMMEARPPSRSRRLWRTEPSKSITAKQQQRQEQILLHYERIAALDNTIIYFA